jgi:hypothetical protein
MRTLYLNLGLTLVVSAGLMQPVFAGKVKAFAGENVDFSRYKTYHWLPPRVLTKVGVDENHPASPVLKELVGRQLSQRGLTELADGSDLDIQAYLLTESTPQLEAVFLAGEFGMIYGTPIATMGRYNRQGTLCINLIDRRTKKSAWLAMTTDSVPTGTMTSEEILSKLDKATRNIFKKYPVKKK